MISNQNENRLLYSLPSAVLERVRPDLERVDLDLYQVLHKPGDDITHIYFPITCMISITITMASGQTIETAAAGSREAVGVNALMGTQESTLTEYIVQLPGEAYRVPAAAMKREFDLNSEFHCVMLCYMQAFIAQISQNAACNRAHQVAQRCARWLLEVRDRVRTDEINLTQEFISQMLGANRVSVSQALGELKDNGLVDMSRNSIRIRNADGLLSSSCECYGVLQEEYDRLLGPYYSKYAQAAAGVTTRIPKCQR